MPRRRHRHATSPPAKDADIHVYDRRALRGGHTVEVLIDGDAAFPRMRDAIAQATAYVHFETYIFMDDLVGESFSQVLIEAAERGIEVRLLVDGFGVIDVPDDFFQIMRRGGVEVQIYRPLGRFRNVGKWTRRDHRKILVIDGTEAYVGGINISKDYISRTAGGGGWRDTHARVTGPAVADLDRIFANTWATVAGGDAPRILDQRQIRGHQRAAVAITEDPGNRTTIRRHYLHAMRQARESVYITNAYFVPDLGLRAGMRGAAKRGVDIRVLLPGSSDVVFAQMAGESTYDRLLRAGVKIYQWEPSHIHAKTLVVDGQFTSIGSYNLDYISLFNNLEVVLEVSDADLGAEMKAQFEADLKSSHEVTLLEWRSRPMWRRWVEWVAYRLRRWL